MCCSSCDVQPSVFRPLDHRWPPRCFLNASRLSKRRALLPSSLSLVHSNNELNRDALITAQLEIELASRYQNTRPGHWQKRIGPKKKGKIREREKRWLSCVNRRWTGTTTSSPALCYLLLVCLHLERITSTRSIHKSRSARRLPLRPYRQHCTSVYIYSRDR